MPIVSLFDHATTEAKSSMSHKELVAAFDAPYSNSSNRRHFTAPRHFLTWLKLRKIDLVDVNGAIVERFASHRCRCPRYRSQPNHDRSYMQAVRMFVHMLEQRGVIRTAKQHGIGRHLAAFVLAQKAKGYVASVVEQMSFDARHFAYWVGYNSDWDQIDSGVIKRFADHDCSCPRSRRGRPGKTMPVARRRHAAQFVAHLVDEGVIITPSNGPVLDKRLKAYSHWLSTARAIPPEGIERCLREVKRWYSKICGKGATCSAKALRSILLDQDPGRSYAAVNQTLSTLRSFVRFLIARGECSADTLAALSVGPRRTPKQVPRYIDRASIEQIIAACDTTTRAGIRDRAVILLLARLGLRAGDVVAMRLDDIDWNRGTLRVSGKSAKAVRLPLPQDAGEAILAYIELVRPTVANRHLFLCLTAPYRPFSGSAVVHFLVKQTVKASGLTGIPSGSHVFRHSLATSMLREGSTLEAIGTVLRHTKPDTTAIYAKVDLNMLSAVAQPWIGGVSC